MRLKTVSLLFSTQSHTADVRECTFSALPLFLAFIHTYLQKHTKPVTFYILRKIICVSTIAQIFLELISMTS